MSANKPTKEQQEAIDFSGNNLLILACAGSGKTETLALRIAGLIKNGVDRGSIVAFTFTEHAASELKQRVRTKLEEAMPDEPSLGDMYVGTIHSFCLRVLRECDPKYRLYEVMDEARQAALIATNFVRFEDTNSGIGLNKLRSRTKSGTYAETLRSFINTLNIVHQQKIKITKDIDPILSEAIESYNKIAFESPNCFFDFNKIIDELIVYFENNEEKLEIIRKKLTHVFVDEYQDVDNRQELLVRLLTNNGVGPKLTVVGDDDQALYGFRGASVRNILTFEERYPNVKKVTLDENFRSTHAIVEIADEAVRKISERIDKEPIARVLKDGQLVERLADKGDIQLQTFGTDADEANWVADRIESLRGVVIEEKGQERGLDYGDMSILLRSVRGSGAEFAEVLRERNIPVVISGTGGLFNNIEVRLIQASFCLLSKSEFATPDQSGRIEILTTLQTREYIRLAIEGLRKSHRFGESTNHSKFLAWIDKKRAELDQRKLGPNEVGKKGSRIYPQEIYQEMLNVLGVKNDEWPIDILFNFGAFSKLLAQFEEVHQWITPSRLKGLTLFLSNWAANNVDEGGLNELSSLNSVKIMTVHAAKGLEWPVVFLPRISSHNFPSSMRTRGPETFLHNEVFDKTVYIGGDDGERRLWYVGLTRCAKFLNVTSIDRPRKKPTIYFKEIDHDCVSRSGVDSTERVKTHPSPPNTAELLPTNYSDLSTYWRCSYEYQLRSLMDFSPGVGEQFGYGQQVHNILAEIHEKAISNNLISVADIDNLVDQRFHLRYTRKDPFEAMKKAVKAGLKKYLQKYGDEVLNARAVEKPFELVDKDSGALISGVVDLLEKGGDELPPSKKEIVGLVDFKAKKIESLGEYNKLEESVCDQLQLYALGVHYAFSKSPQFAAAHIISHSELPDEVKELGKSERIPIDVGIEARENIYKKVSETIKKIRSSIETQEFEKTGVSKGECKKCDYRKICSGYDKFAVNKKNIDTNSTPADDMELEVFKLVSEMNAGSQAK